MPMPSRKARLYFYDAMGAQFEVADFAATGSGSPAVRRILYYENKWGKSRCSKLKRRRGDRARVARARYGGRIRHGHRRGRSERQDFSDVKIVSSEGIITLPDEKIGGSLSKNSAMIEEPYRWVEAIANRREYIETNSRREVRSRR